MLDEILTAEERAVVARTSTTLSTSAETSAPSPTAHRWMTDSSGRVTAKMATVCASVERSTADASSTATLVAPGGTASMTCMNSNEFSAQ